MGQGAMILRYPCWLQSNRKEAMTETIGFEIFFFQLGHSWPTACIIFTLWEIWGTIKHDPNLASV